VNYLFRIVMITVIAFSLTASAALAASPGAPSGLVLKIEGKGVLLSWKASPDDPGKVTGYEIVRADVASGPFKKVGKVKKGIFQYNDKTAKPEIIYFYKVRAVAGKSFSDYSQPAAVERPGN
jgi:hypothetical protein